MSEIKLTDLELTVLKAAACAPNRIGNITGIAWSLPQWRKRAAHGAIVANVKRAACRLEEYGLCWALHGKDRWDNGDVALRPEGVAFLENLATDKGKDDGENNAKTESSS